MRIYRHSAIVAAVIMGSLGLFIWTSLGSFGACVVGDLNENFQKTIAALDGIADLGLKLSTSLVGFGAALLIGIKTGVSLTTPVRTALLVSMLMFVQSALYAVWWRFGIATSWLNKCLNMVAEDFMQRRYEAHLIFFLLGLISLGALVIIAIQVRREEPAQGDQA